MDTTIAVYGLIALNIMLVIRAELVARLAAKERDLLAELAAEERDTLTKLAAAERAAATAERNAILKAAAEERQVLLNRIQAPEVGAFQTLDAGPPPTPEYSEQQEIDDAQAEFFDPSETVDNLAAELIGGVSGA